MLLASDPLGGFFVAMALNLAAIMAAFFIFGKLGR